MLRSAVLTLSLSLALGIFASAQVVSNGGYATTYPAAVPPDIANTVTSYAIPSIPAINTPVAHVGPSAQLQPVPPQVYGTAPAQVEIQNPAPVTVQVSPTSQSSNGQAPFNFGAANLQTNPFISGRGTNGRSLGEIARLARKKEQTTNAKMYTNSDIEQMNQSTGINTNTSANASNWPANNGLITPSPIQQPGSIAAPSQSQSTTGNSPFVPRPHTAAPPVSPAAPSPSGQLPPQANAKPSPDHPYEMAAINPANAGLPPAAGEQNAAASGQAANHAQANTAKAKQRNLPGTGSRLPLIGVLGFISISTGLFVRHQREREKTSK